MKQAQFEITTDLAPLRSFLIDANFAEVEDFLRESLEPYKSMVVTEDGLAIAKTYRANIRKVKQSLDAARKEAKAAALASYLPFEEKVKVLTALCDDSANNIDMQVKNLEDRAREQKIEQIKKYYDANVGDTAEYLSWEDVLNPKWGNATYNIQTAISELTQAIATTRMQLAAIRNLKSEHEISLLEHYKSTHDLTSVLAKHSALTQIAEYEAAKKKEAPTPKPVVEELPSVPSFVEEVEEELVPETIVAPAPAAEPKKTVRFFVQGTAAQLSALKKFLKDNNITYGKVDEHGY